MSKKVKADLPTWSVEIEITRNITVRVEAADEEEARQKARESDIIGDEIPGDTINQTIIDCTRED